MVPYFRIPDLHLGPLTVGPFGVLVALGIIIGTRICTRIAQEDRLDPHVLDDYAPWGVAAGVLGGHWVHVFLYHPEELSRSSFQAFKFWDGLSSTGGLIGALVAAF